MAEKISGIYKIECLANGKVYVGQSINIIRRFGSHKSMLRNNRHENIHLQSAWDKYGEENFTFEIIEEFEQNLDDREKYWISYFDSLENGFNMTEGGRVISKETRKKSTEKRIGKNLSEETKLKISKALRSGYKNGSIVQNPEARKGIKNWKSVPIYQFDTKTLEIINRFDCVEDAEREVGTNGGIGLCINHKNTTCKGFYWQKVEETIDGKYTGKLIMTISPKAKKINQIDFNTGEIINTFNSRGEANIYFNKNKENGCISSCLSGVTKRAFGYKWEHEEKEIYNI